MLVAGHYDGEIDLQGLRHGHGTYIYPNTHFEYEGQWTRGAKHGHGVLRMSDGSSIEGNCFVDGEIEGLGKRIWQSGQIYTGNFHLGEMDGQGTLQGADGSVFEGEWRKNKRHGQGTLRFADGSVYEGGFQDHGQTGEGMLRLPQGDVFQGQWARGEKQGSGKMTWADGAVYDGQWSRGCFQGSGTFHAGAREDGPPQRSYAGAFEGGRPTVQATAIVWDGLLPLSEGEEEPPPPVEEDPKKKGKAKAAEPAEEEGPAPVRLTASVPSRPFAVKCQDESGEVASYESGRVISATLRRLAQKEVPKGKPKKGEEVPEEPPEVLSEVSIASTPSVGGVATFHDFTLPADTEAGTYDGEYELVFTDGTPEHPLLNFARVADEFGAKIAALVAAAPPPPAEEE